MGLLFGGGGLVYHWAIFNPSEGCYLVVVGSCLLGLINPSVWSVWWWPVGLVICPLFWCLAVGLICAPLRALFVGGG